MTIRSTSTSSSDSQALAAPHSGVFLFGTMLCLLYLPLGVQAASGVKGETKSEASFVEPILTEETMPNEPGELTLRVSNDYRKLGSESIVTLPEIQLFYGLAERLGAELNAPLAHHRGGGHTTHGLGDTSLGLKYLVLEHSSNWPAVVVGLEAGFPTGDVNRRLGEGALELEPFVALLKDFQRFSLQGNFGWSTELNRDRDDRFTYNWALAVPLVGRKVHLMAEINGDWGREPQTSVAPGIKYNFTDNQFIAVGVPYGLNEHTPGWGLVTQFQFRF